MIGRDRSEARAAANHLDRHDNSAEIISQAEHDRFVEESAALHQELKLGFEQTEYRYTLENLANELGSRTIESARYAFNNDRSFGLLSSEIVTDCLRPIHIGATTENLSWISDDPTMPVRAVEGVILRYRDMTDDEDFSERGLFVVAYKPSDSDEPSMISFGELDEFDWQGREGEKLAATRGMGDGRTLDGALAQDVDDQFGEYGISMTEDQETFIRNLFGKEEIIHKRRFRKDILQERMGLFRLRERPLVAESALVNADEFEELKTGFIDRYYNPMLFDKEFQRKVEDDLELAQDMARFGDTTHFMAAESLAKALNDTTGVLMQREVIPPYEAIAHANHWPASLMSMEDTQLYKDLNEQYQEYLYYGAKKPVYPELEDPSSSLFLAGNNDTPRNRFVLLASDYRRKHGTLEGLLY